MLFMKPADIDICAGLNKIFSAPDFRFHIRRRSLLKSNIAAEFFKKIWTLFVSKNLVLPAVLSKEYHGRKCVHE